MSELPPDDPPHIVEIPMEDHSIFIVGENHSSEESNEAVMKLLKREKITTVAIESCPDRWSINQGSPISKGIEAAHNHVKKQGGKLVLIDEYQNKIIEKFQKIPHRMNLNYEKPSLWEERETKMANYISSASEKFREDFAVVVGASHINTLISKILMSDRTVELPEERVKDF